MKNLGLFILGVVVGIAAMYFYCQSSEAEQSVELAAETLNAPSGLITVKEAKTLDRAFDSRHRLISDSIVTREGGDNRSSWFALQDVKDFLVYAEKESENQGYTMDGIRVYLGAYPDSDEEAGYTTMFLWPTGVKKISEGALFNYALQNGGGSPDNPNGPGLNKGNNGDPPQANFPQ
ncbi:MAG: hypothetical protein AAF688_03610 [Bacteroidota bacterium]